MSAGTEVGPLADTFDYHANNPHPNAICPVCKGLKLLREETCSEFCADLFRWMKTQLKKHNDSTL